MVYENLSEVRKQIDWLNIRIINRLAYRATFPLNAKVYEKTEDKESMLGVAIREKEKYFARLGRWKFPDQHPLIKQELPEPAVPRSIPEKILADVEIDVREDVKMFYMGLVKDLCREGDNPNSYGETADCDADNLELLSERVMLGLYVADSKARDDLTIKDDVDSPKLLDRKLRNIKREEEVIGGAKEVAEHYSLDLAIIEKYFKSISGEITKLDPVIIGKFFRWIIEETTKVEVEYLQKKFEVNKKSGKKSGTEKLEPSTAKVSPFSPIDKPGFGRSKDDVDRPSKNVTGW